MEGYCGGLKKVFFRPFGPHFGLKIRRGEEARAPLLRFRHWCYPTFAQLGPDPDCSEKKKRGFFSVKKVRSQILNIEAVIIES